MLATITHAGPCAGLYQRRVAAVRLLGELYNYRMVSSVVVFITLHNLLAYGYDPGTPPEVTRWVDPGSRVPACLPAD